MGTRMLPRLLASALLLAFVAQGTALSEEEKKQKRRLAQPQGAPATQPARAQTQTAPNSTQTKPQTAPVVPGRHSVTGWVMKVNPERKSLFIRTTTNEYEVFVTAQTEVTRDNRPASLKEIRPHDRVDACQFNAKHVVQQLTLTSGDSLGVAPRPQKN